MLPRLARILILSYCTFQITNNKDADQTARMLRLVCTFVVRILKSQVFSRQGPFIFDPCHVETYLRNMQQHGFSIDNPAQPHGRLIGATGCTQAHGSIQPML